jgi:hypothetical protein
MVPEVAVYFEYSLYRGNRTVKVHASGSRPSVRRTGRSPKPAFT